jgi:SAM-dependent methyltransferase
LTETPESPERTDFNEFADSYREDLERSIGFAGGEADLFIGLKARLLTEIAARQLGPPGELEVLDVGCGVGETARFLKGSFGSLRGVDIAADSVARAAEANPWAEFGSYPAGGPLPAEDASVDLAYTVCVLHHVPPAERRAFLDQMRRVVRPGGVVAVFEHNPFNPLTRKAVRDCAFDADAVLLSRGQARSLLEESGLTPLEARYILFFPRQGARLRAIERRLGRLPLGAQYYVACRRG